MITDCKYPQYFMPATHFRQEGMGGTVIYRRAAEITAIISPADEKERKKVKVYDLP